MLKFHVNLFGHPFTWTWEQAAERLGQLPRMIFEPDGSWVWSGGVGPERWQVDGHLFDFSERLYRVELHGECPEEQMDQLLGCFGWPGVTLSFEMACEGVLLDEAQFREAAQAVGKSRTA
jgi:hypothetical protein